MSQKIIDRITQMQTHATKKQRILCTYIIEHQSYIGMMTVAELAAKAGVGTTLVLRFAEMLGYDSYIDFKKAFMEEQIQKENHSYTMLMNSFRSPDHASVISDLIGEFNYHCSVLVSPEFSAAYEKTIAQLQTAKQVNILGLRSSAAFASYLSNSLSTFMPDIRNLSFEQEYLTDRIFEMSSDEVLFLISVWPSTRRTVQIAQLCARQGIPIILLTNALANPIAQYADTILNINSMNQSHTDLFLITVLSSLVQDLGSRMAPLSTEALANLEKQLAENDIIQWE